MKGFRTSPWSYSSCSTPAVRWLLSGRLTTLLHLWPVAKHPMITCLPFTTLFAGFSRKSLGKPAGKVTSCWGKSPLPVHRPQLLWGPTALQIIDLLPPAGLHHLLLAQYARMALCKVAAGHARSSSCLCLFPNRMHCSPSWMPIIVRPGEDGHTWPAAAS